MSWRYDKEKEKRGLYARGALLGVLLHGAVARHTRRPAWELFAATSLDFFTIRSACHFAESFRDQHPKTMATPAAATTEPVEQVALARECEYRVEVGAQSAVTLKLKSGSAELFGVELAPERVYTLRDRKAAVFTWFGCALEVAGAPDVAYASEETPMSSYLNTHAQLQRRRELAAAKRSAGPRVLVAGPVDAGKSTLAHVLLAYALRLGEKPTFVDLDVGQGALSVPGTLTATPLDMNSLSVEVSGWVGGSEAMTRESDGNCVCRKSSC